MSKTVKLDEKEYGELNRYAGSLRFKLNRPVSLSEALADLLGRTDKSRPSDFIGSWKMTDKEAKRIRKELKDVWKTWKLK